MKLLTLIFLLSSSVYAQKLSFSKERVRFLPPSVKTTAAFMDIKNLTDSEIVIVKASSKVSNVTELHNHFKVDGMMKMREVPSINIPAKGVKNLKPGSFHVMLIDLKKPLKMGQEVLITFTLDDGSTVDVKAPVKKMKMMMHKKGMH
jgi:copper(I)-binding protein